MHTNPALMQSGVEACLTKLKHLLRRGGAGDTNDWKVRLLSLFSLAGCLQRHMCVLLVIQIEFTQTRTHTHSSSQAKLHVAADAASAIRNLLVFAAFLERAGQTAVIVKTLEVRASYIFEGQQMHCLQARHSDQIIGC